MPETSVMAVWSGLSWLGDEVMASEPSFFRISHAQPLPKREAAAALNLFLTIMWGQASVFREGKIQ